MGRWDDVMDRDPDGYEQDPGRVTALLERPLTKWRGNSYPPINEDDHREPEERDGPPKGWREP